MQTKYDLPFCGLSMKLYSTGKKTPSYEYSGEASKVKFMCSLTKRKYSLSQVTEWFQTPEVQKYVQAGYVLKYMTKIQETNNPSPYAKSNLEQVFCLVMVKKQNRPAQNVDGLKPVAQTIPQVQQQPTASDESFDDDLAPF
tara:strand:- start:464 stop:886 length:423 start_codon:yes stop_codon:yes gene_type:complete